MQGIMQGIRDRKKWLAGVALLAVLAGGGVWWQSNRTAAPVTTDTTQLVARGDIRAVVSATGTVKAETSIAVGSRVTGLITEVRVKENDIVKKGQVLVVLDDSAAREQVAQFQAQVANYSAAYERSRKLSSVGGQAASQLDTDRMNYQVALANYNNYAAQLKYYVITAPADGRVLGTPSPVGTTIVQGFDAAQTILTIADMSKMQVKVLVDETDIGKVKVGQIVSFTVDAYADKTFSGKVTRISRDATTSSNVVYYPVYVDVDSPEDLLYPTMTARVTIAVGERSGVLTVPLAAVKEGDGRKTVAVMTGGKAREAAVTTGLGDDEHIEILSGLQEGDVIVVPGAKAKATGSSSNQGPPPPM